MTRRSPLAQSRRHILVYDEDWEFIEMAFGRDSPSRMGVSVAIRQIIHKRVGEIRATYLARLDADRRPEARADVDAAAADIDT